MARGEALLRRAERHGRLRRPGAAREPDARVVVDNEASAAATVLEVHAVDQVGVLYRIARALADARLDIRHAKVTTLGVEAIDTFYVVDEENRKIADPTRVDAIRTLILDSVQPAAVP